MRVILYILAFHQCKITMVDNSCANSQSGEEDRDMIPLSREERIHFLERRCVVWRNRAYQTRARLDDAFEYVDETRSRLDEVSSNYNLHKDLSSAVLTGALLGLAYAFYEGSLILSKR